MILHIGVLQTGDNLVCMMRKIPTDSNIANTQYLQLCRSASIKTLSAFRNFFQWTYSRPTSAATVTTEVLTLLYNTWMKKDVSEIVILKLSVSQNDFLKWLAWNLLCICLTHLNKHQSDAFRACASIDTWNRLHKQTITAICWLYVICKSRLIPVCPMGPVLPRKPCWPLGPIGPIGPVNPVNPGGPCSPVAPVEPVLPDCPVDPAT